MTLIFVIILIALLTTAIASLSLIVWVPTRKKDLDRIAAMASLKNGENFIDLGCGTGTVCCHVAKNSEANIFGIELALPFYAIAKIRQLFLNKRSLKIIWGNLFNISLGNFDVIYVFGIPDKLKDKAKPKLERELKPGARVISYVFAIEGWTPARVDKPTPDSASIYLYQR
ncbi:class I SAM-dependent methyltransferase [Candidatus Falkowbacteria bacterium]|nr:class I SAM-dependent methyltransferase [Candidatus Falkowbacteria bacterium]